MENIGKYILIQQIEETRGSIVYRAKNEGDPDTVIIKALKVEYPSPADIARFRQEYQLIKEITIPGVIQYLDLIDYRHGTIAMVWLSCSRISMVHP